MEFLGGLWIGNTFVGRLIVVAILILAVRTVMAGASQYARYRAEISRLADVRLRLRNWQRDQGVISESAAAAGEGIDPEEAADEPGAALVDLVALGEGIPSESLVAERLAAIRDLRAHRVRVNVDTLQQLSYARDAAQPGAETPSFVAGMAMMLGILGTFVGLSVMVQQIHLGLPDPSAVSLDTWSQSIHNLRNVLGGMKTAFSTSVAGMACAIGALSVDFRLQRLRASFFEDFDRFSARELLPAAVPAVDDESLLEQVTFRLEESFDRLEAIYRQNRRSLEELTGVQETFRTIVEEIRAITRAEAARDLDRVLDLLSGVTQTLTRVGENLPGLVNAVRQNARDVVERVERAAMVPPSPAQSLPRPIMYLLALLGAAIVVTWLRSL